MVAGGGLADAGGLREFLPVAVTAPFLSRWCAPEASCLRASPRDGAHPDDQGSRRRSSRPPGSIRRRRAGSLGVRGLSCGPAVWGCGGREDGAGALAEVLGELTDGGSPASSTLLGKIGAAFYFEVSADRRLARLRPGGSYIISTSTVRGELVLL